MSIEIRNISKTFKRFQALKNVSLEVPTGELVALLGPSGCGKTTLLRVIAGLEAADAGHVYFHGEDATDRHVRERQVGFVFQHYALFRHMTVFENVAFGLRVRPRKLRPSDAEIRARVLELLKLVQVDWLGDRHPPQLSGGQRQRVALARALAVEPKVLLLDEPFGALDAKVRKDLRRWLRRLHDELHITSVFVTHDQEEAMEVSDRVVVMNHGQIEQIGSPSEVYDKPASEFVVQFIGQVNLFRGRVHCGWAHIGDTVRLAMPEYEQTANTDAVAYVRPHELELHLQPNGTGGYLVADVENITVAGALLRLDLRQDGTDEPIRVEVPRGNPAQEKLKSGDRVYLRPIKHRVFIDENAGTAGEKEVVASEYARGPA
ncbi:MAG: sulfate ABC transporter ATP-binding protein [Pseudomonadota bacterium]|nr:sulfate ABC transporter ATP-binding protein [Pseudomonadota bacterium]